MRALLPDKGLGKLLLALLAGGFILNFFMQSALLNMNIYSVLEWIGEFYGLYLAGGLLLFCGLLVCSMLLPNPYIGPAAAGLLMVITGFAGYQKLSTTGEPLFPWDLMLLKNAGEMSRIAQGMVSPLMLATAALLVAGLTWLIIKLPKQRISLQIRVLLTGVSASAVAGFIFLVGSQSQIFTSLKYENIFWNQKVNYSQNGFLFAFAGNLRQNLMEEPEGYSRDAIAEIAAKYNALPDVPAAAGKEEQPNILFMMDEAFFDPTRLPDYQFSEDPLKFIHQQQGKVPSGLMLSPEFGGNTANIEFEALTGMSMYFLKDGSIPYQQRIVKMSSLPSIVSILKERGYRALALHPFDGTFYNRNRVYPVLGFDSFTSEQDLEHAERMTPAGYITDKFAVEEAVRQLKSSREPAFLHLVTMQNHFPFTKGLNGPNTIKVQGLPSAYTDEFETYVQNTKLTDEALAYLQQELKTIERRTVVVFWGDHLPALSAGIYRNAGWDKEPRLKHETTLLMMANFELPAEPLGTLSPAFIGPEVFRLTGQSLPAYYKLLEQVRKELPGLSKNVLIGPDGERSELDAAQQLLLDDYRMVQYDMLEGENYAQSLLF
ncbi:hypothetical protein C2I18_24220 [Paenibacillus sp. PK3_47]|uniref:LTA synthase family protein n=1 Tax=Paenibacillus sp. PK3_47 TaxID=2072642 RepID=UPI00201E3E40|nr:LTA synthase family protein [Paenibacillus sp. PK3_47]UQZ36360.1 hypothetical protein C2I18_24220 [Paenibacillus sp. PK3_47]